MPSDLGENNPSNAAAGQRESRLYFLADGKLLVTTVGETAEGVVNPDCGVAVAIRRAGVYEEIELERTPALILAKLAMNPEQLVTYEEIAEAVATGRTRKLDVAHGQRQHVHNLREALGDELGDVKTGVVRIAYGLGLIALRTFDLKVAGRPEPDEIVLRAADGRIEVNPGRKIARIKDLLHLAFTPTQYRLLEILARDSPNPSSHESLAEAMPGIPVDDPYFIKNLRLHISGLRRQFNDPQLRAAVQSVPKGYVLLQHLPEQTGSDDEE